jgi:hypothetical protein
MSLPLCSILQHTWHEVSAPFFGPATTLFVGWWGAGMAGLGQVQKCGSKKQKEKKKKKS